MKSSITMEELKLKFFELINKQNQLKIPSMGLNPDLLNPVTVQYECDIQSKESRLTKDEAIPDQEILESIESVYYEADNSLNSCRYELNKLPHNLNCNDIGKYHNRLKRQQYVVSKKVLELILQKQSACNEKFSEILKIQNELENLIEICKVGRSNLNLAKEEFTTASLGILANYKKRQTVQKLLSSLNTIKTLQRTGNRLEELMMEENYPGAISLLLECQNVAQTYKHFYCVEALNGKLHDILEQAEETLDAILAKICRQFDEKTYSSVQVAYKLLGKTQSVIDQLHMHFTAAIHNAAFSVIHSYTGGDIEWQYNHLCQSITQGTFIAAFTELSRALWKIISSYYQVLNWHVTQMKNGKERNDGIESEVFCNNQYIKKKLESDVMRTWHDVETKISTLLESTDITSFKFEQIVQILAIVNRLMEVGAELCGSQSEYLQSTMRKQCLSYFSHYHASRLDELRIFLEHDGWELCPVKSTFVATQLQEFKSLRPSLINCKALSSKDGSNICERDNYLSRGWLFKYLQNDISPFDVGLDEIVDEDILMNVEPSEYFSEDSDDEGNEELRREISDDIHRTRISKKTYKFKHSGPMVTNTTLSVLRVCGKYLQMSRLLSSIAVTVIQSMIQFFELCFFAIHSFFASDIQISSDSLYSSNLKLTLIRIRENLIISENERDCDEEKNKIHSPQLSSTVDLHAVDKLFGLNERVVGVESLIFLGQQYQNLQSYLMQLIENSPEQVFLNQFYNHTIASAIDLRKPVYMTVISKAFNVTNVLSLMNRVNWEVRDVMSQHSDYVDSILEEIKHMAQHINQVDNVVPLSMEVKNTIWENVAHLVTHTLVEGFANAKKCSNGGRGLMQLDFTQLKSKYEMMTFLRPMPHSAYVETYIKAYYIPENHLEEWIKKHQEYSVKHLIGLILCACQNNKKSRQRLIAAVEEHRYNR